MFLKIVLKTPVPESNPIQDGGGQKASPPHYQFFPCIFYKRRNFRLLVLTLLKNWCKISSLYLVPVPNYLAWTKTTPQKVFFLVKSL